MVSPQKGDIIRFPRNGYSHFGIYLGNDQVIHRSGGPGDQSTVPASSLSMSGIKNSKATIRIDTLDDVAGDCDTAEIANYLDGKTKRGPYSPDEIVQRAMGELDKPGYNVIFKNCEHFVTWCRYGVKHSQQVLDYFLALTGGPIMFLISQIKRKVTSYSSQ